MKILKRIAILSGALTLGLAAEATVVFEDIQENDTVQTKPKEKPASAAEAIKTDVAEEETPPPKVPPVPVPPAVPGKPAEPPPLPAGQKGVSAGVFMIRQGERTEVVLRNGETYVIRKDSSHNQILAAIRTAEQTGAQVSLTIEASTGRILSASAGAAKSP